VSFGVLALIVCAGLAGPLFSAARPKFVPVVVGEILAGVVIGQTGFRWLDTHNPTVNFLADIGFAMLMFSAGIHVPVRNRALLGGVRRAALAAVIVALLAVVGGVVLAAFPGVSHPAVYALLLATGSAAIALPMLDEAGLLSWPPALTAIAQVTIADVATIAALPLVLQPGRAARSALGIAVIALCAVALTLLADVARRRDQVRSLRKLSKERTWALDLRLSLLILFVLAWLATVIGTSILIAGFCVGLSAAWLGGPKRFSRQVVGIAQGFFVPLFFVVLGARLDLRALVDDPTLIGLAAAIAALNLAVHLVAARATRQPLGAGLVTTAQLGVPAAVVTLGLNQGIITAGQGAAIVAAALASLGFAAAGTSLLTRSRPPPATEPAESGGLTSA